MNGSRKSTVSLLIRFAALLVAALGVAVIVGTAGHPAQMQVLRSQSLAGAQLEAQATKADVENSWGLKSIFAHDAQQIASEKAKAAGTAGTPVCVAILDTGFYPDHEALKGRVVAEWNAAAIGQISVPEQRRAAYVKANMSSFRKTAEGASIAPPAAIASDTSEANHGIHVASILGSVDPDVKFVLIRVADDAGEMPTWALYNAFSLINEYRDEFNIRVVNCSAGSAGEPTDQNTWEYATLQQINAAYQNGVVTVGSAGNEASTTFNFPSDCENVVGVMSLEYDAADNPYAVHRFSTSNYNAAGETGKNICAPGAHIPGAVRKANGSYSYELMSGTSMAAPHVAGVLALMMQASPSAYAASADGADAAIGKLYNSATRLGTVDAKGWSQDFGWGEVNAAAAVSDGGEIPVAATTLTNGTETALTMSCPGAQSLAYEWAIPYGQDNAEFVGATNAARATLRAKQGGSVVVSCIGKPGGSASSGGLVYWAHAVFTVEGCEITGPSAVVVDSAMPASYASSKSGKQFGISGLPSGASVKWSESSNGKVLSISDAGVVSGKAIGTATVYAELSTGALLEKEVEVTSVDLAELSGLGYYLALFYETATYDGTEQKPAIKTYVVKESWQKALAANTVSIDSDALKNDIRQMKQGTDFAVSRYSNNVNAGTQAALVYIEGTGNYSGEKSYRFTIEPGALAASNVKLAKTKYTYDGKAHKPAVTVTSNGKTLTAGTDYTVKWENYIAAGTAKVTVTGKGNYGGTATKTYTIAKANNTLAVKALARSARASALKKKALTLACPVSATKAQGAVTFAKKSGNSKISVNKTTGKLKLARGLKKGAYKVKIQVHAAGTASYYGLTRQVTVTVRVV